MLILLITRTTSSYYLINLTNYHTPAITT